LRTESYADFAEALQWIADQPALSRLALSQAARKTALRLSIQQTADQALKYYARIISQQTKLPGKTEHQLKQLLQLLAAEWTTIEEIANSASQSMLGGEPEGKRLADL